jgi:hypothetical protein
MHENLGAKIPKSQNKTCSALLQTAATGELEGGYREIVQVLQENPFGPTVKSLRPYRRISYGAEARSALMLRHGQYRS